MSRKILEKTVRELDERLIELETARINLIDNGVAESIAGLVGPRPEAKVYVTSMRTLFRKMDEREITTRDHILSELEDAYVGLRMYRNDSATASLQAVLHVAKSLFLVERKDIEDADRRASARYHGERHGWNGVLGD